MAILNSAIYIYSGVPLDKEHNDVTNLSTSALMTAWASSKLVASKTNYSFIRDRGVIRADFTYTQALGCNYMIFQNPTYDNKYFCAFIDHVEYVNEKTVEISYTIDNFQTWFNGLSAHSVMVEREHISGDAININVEPEPVTPSQMVVESVHRLDLGEYSIIVCYTPTDLNDHPEGYVVGEMVSGAKIKKFRTHSGIGENRVPDLSDFYDWVNDFQGDYGTIVSIFLYPAAYVTISNAEADYTQYGFPHATDLNIPYKTTIHGYTPKNKKCFRYPYMYFSADTGEAHNIYKPELFMQNNAVNPPITGYTFTAIGCGLPTAEIDLYPKYYNGFTDATNNHFYNRTEKLPMNQFPQIAFPIDTYKAWLAQCQSTALYSILADMGTSMFTGGMAGGATAGLTGGAGSGLRGVANELLQENAMREASNKWMGSQGGSIDLAMDLLEFDIKVMAPPVYELRAIDEFFSMFGYATNRVKVPNINTRQNWNYVKVATDCIYGTAPAEALQEINNVFKRGVTLWHNANNIGNYGDMTNSQIV